ncbi:leucine-rich repeat isoform f [Anaeramoeba flamelloides]|uniref:Leucine-rich repeat isoform f n=1 Tax=Anaeramoeba flamelloides TaxID=1746091 RepID=A0AAV8ACP2_9EUKA|nr:leucine-rich repeat isoform f [Anaeramoeba flamelloides]
MSNVSKSEKKIQKKQKKEEAKYQKKLKKKQRKIEKKKRKLQKKTKKIDLSQLKDLTIEERTVIEGMVDDAINENVLLVQNILKKKSFKKIEKRIFVLTLFRVLTIGKRKKSLKKKVCRNGHLYDLKKIEYFDKTHFKLQFKDFLIDVHHPKALSILETIKTNYSRISIGLPNTNLCIFEDFSILASGNSLSLIGSGEENSSKIDLNQKNTLFVQKIQTASISESENKSDFEEETQTQTKTNEQVEQTQNQESNDQSEKEQEDQEKTEQENKKEEETQEKEEKQKEEEQSDSLEIKEELTFGSKMNLKKVKSENEKLNLKGHELPKLENKTYFRQNMNKDEMLRAHTVDCVTNLNKTSSIWNLQSIHKKTKYQGNGFSEQYKAWCSYYKTPISKAFLKFVKNECYENKNKGKRKMLDLSNFRRIDLYMDNSIDIYPIVAALKHNDYFTKFRLSNIYRKDPITLMSEVLEFNSSLTEMTLSGLESSEGFGKLGKAIRKNPDLHLTLIDLSGNKIQSKEAKNLAHGLSCLQYLETLNLSFCNLSESSVATILLNLLACKNIKYLSLSGNKFGKKGAELLNQVILKNQLKVLMLDFTGIDFRYISSSLVKSKIEVLSLIGNKFNKEAFWCLAETFKVVSSVKKLDISNATLTHNYFPLLLDSILLNDKLKNFSLSASGNQFGPDICHKILEVFETNTESESLEELILDNNEFASEGINLIFKCAAMSKSLKKLSISRNILKGKDIELIEQSFIDFLTNSICLTHFRCKGNEKYHLGKDFCDVFKKIEKTKVFHVLDLSGNNFTNEGLNIISNCLFQNKLLVHSLFIDNNGWDLSSFENFSNAVQKNHSLVTPLWPEKDSTSILTSSSKKSSKSVKTHISKMKEKYNKHCKKNSKKLPKYKYIGLTISADGIESMNQKELLFYLTQLFSIHKKSIVD